MNNGTMKPLNQNRMKETALEFYAEQEVKLTLDFLANKINQVEYGIKRVKLIEQAKEMEIKQAHDYAEFAIICDRKDMKILNFDGYMNLETFKSE